MNQPSPTTRQRILEAAEYLYGADGVWATSLRGIVRRANVNLNAVNYHFGSQQEVTAQLFANIMEPINAERIELLNAVGGEPPPLRPLVHAIYWPVFRRAVETEEGRRRIAIVNQIRQDPRPESRELVQANLESFVPQFESRLCAATGLTRKSLVIPIRLMIATAWGLVSQSIVLDEIAFQKGSRKQKRVFDRFLDYTVAGFESLVR